MPPLIFQMPPEQGRRALEEAQDAPVYKYPADISREWVSTGMWGSIPVYFIAPVSKKIRNIIFYIHGAGWVYGSFHTHEKLVRELSARTDSLVVFPEYSRSPEAKYPTATEQCYFILSHIKKIIGDCFAVDNNTTLTVAGDSAGGNMAIAMVLMSAMRRGACIDGLLLYYPVTDACFDTLSYRQFAENYYLYREGMKWFWDQYTMSPCDRNEITASPLRADIDQLKGLPDAMILNGEADVLRDEGEAYARKLREAGVDVTAVRFQGMIHDFVMLNALDQTKACRAAMDTSVAWINRKNRCQEH